MEFAELLEKATELGAEHGRAGGSWVLDGNTSEATITECLLMDDDGDPQWFDRFGPATGPLSGEWADGLTGALLCEKLGIEAIPDDFDPAIADLCLAYENAYYMAWHDEVIRSAMAMSRREV